MFNNHNNVKLKNLRQSLRKRATFQERKVWSVLRNKQIQNFKFYRQYGIRNYILDFYCHSLSLRLKSMATNIILQKE